MSIYKKKRVTTHGKERVMYWRDGKLVSVREVPAPVTAADIFDEEIDLPETQAEIAATPVEDVAQAIRPDKVCLFCGKYGKNEKFLHLQTVFLCDEDWDNKTTGQIGAKIREIYG